MKKHRHGVKRLGADEERVRAKGIGFLNMSLDKGPDVGRLPLGNQFGQAVGILGSGEARVMNAFFGKGLFVSPQAFLKRACASLVRSNVEDQSHEQPRLAAGKWIRAQPNTGP